MGNFGVTSHSCCEYEPPWALLSAVLMSKWCDYFYLNSHMCLEKQCTLDGFYVVAGLLCDLLWSDPDNGLDGFYVVAGLLCDLLWSDPDKDVQGWGENDRGVSFTFGADVVSKFLNRHDLDLITRAHQVCGLSISCIDDRLQTWLKLLIRWWMLGVVWSKRKMLII